jgi:hypothetical protein
MQKWEYLYINSAFNQNHEWIPQWINGVELRDWANGPRMYEVSNQLGEQGWELVGIFVTEGSYRTVFKRYKE